MKWRIVCLLCAIAWGVLLKDSVVWGQQVGHSIQGNRVVIDSEEHWSAWKSAPKTIQITDEGVRPFFIRKSTEIEIDGQIVRVPGINASLNAPEFGGDDFALEAGSNPSKVSDLLDGRMDTFWEPDRNDPIEDWWVRIDLGRAVTATKVVLKFVGEDLGNPFLQFKVLTSQGLEDNKILRTRQVFTTDKPLKDKRVVEVELTLTGKFVRGGSRTPSGSAEKIEEFSGDAIRYVTVQITDSDFGKERPVSKAAFESLESNRMGDIEYFRKAASGRLRLLSGKEVWEDLDESKQGPVVHYRRELPRLAELEVWSIGDNVALGVIDRGGTLSSLENRNEERVVNGDITDVWLGKQGFEASNVPPSEPLDVERDLFIDLGGTFFLDNVRVIMSLTEPPSGFHAYFLKVSDGSLAADEGVSFKTVASKSGIGSEDAFHSHNFELTKVRFFKFTTSFIANPTGGGGTPAGLAELQFFGEGFVAKSQIESVFEEGSPFIELGTSKNLVSIEWDADTPPGTDVIIQTKTGDTSETEYRYFDLGRKKEFTTNRRGESPKVQYEKKVNLFWKKRDPDPPTLKDVCSKGEDVIDQNLCRKWLVDENTNFEVGPIDADILPGNDWSGWSQPYEHPGDKITSPSPRKFLSIRATLLTDDPQESATLRSVTLNFLNPVAANVVGEIKPSRLDKLGVNQEFSYFIRPTFDPQNQEQEFDEILIEAPPGVRMNFKQVNKWEDESIEDMIINGLLREPDESYTVRSKDFEVLSRDESDSLWVHLPSLIGTTTDAVLIEVQFEATLFGFSTFFDGSIGNSFSDEVSWQRVDDGDANGVTDSEKTIVLALEGNKILDNIVVDPEIFTPNGDGINDETSISFSLLRLALSQVQVQIYDLSGNIVVELLNDSLSSGAHTVTWAGVDKSGDLVPPGIYLLRINIDTDSGSAEDTSVNRLVSVAY